jgi:hypothetical protein
MRLAESLRMTHHHLDSLAFPLGGRVLELFRERHAGVILTHDQRRVAFDSRQLCGAAFEKLRIGDSVQVELHRDRSHRLVATRVSVLPNPEES